MSWREIYEFMTGDLAEVMDCARRTIMLFAQRAASSSNRDGVATGSDCPLLSKTKQEKARLHQIRITPLSSGIFFVTIADF